MQLYDYIYVDLDKAISLYSQLTGGVVELRESNFESGKTADNKRKYDFKVFKHDAGGTTQNREQSKEVIKPYHSFLIELEQLLLDEGHLVDLSSETDDSSLRDAPFRQHVLESFAIKATGRSVIEDYERIKGISAAFPNVVKLINKSTEASVLESEEYKKVQAEIDEAEDEAKKIKDRNKRSQATQIVKQRKKVLADLLTANTGIDAPPEWLLDGLQTWINTFLPGIINLRVYPSEDRTDEHVLGHLKRECFTDSDSASFHFTYGSFPTEKLTVVGIVASVPNEGGEDFDPLEEFSKPNLEDAESVENAFRGVFRGFDGF